MTPTEIHISALEDKIESLTTDLIQYKEAARSEAQFVNELQVENRKLREVLMLFAFPEGKLEHEDVVRVSARILLEINGE